MFPELDVRPESREGLKDTSTQKYTVYLRMWEQIEHTKT